MFLDQLRAACEAAQTLSAISSLERTIWQTAWPDHIGDDDGQELAEDPAQQTQGADGGAGRQRRRSASPSRGRASPGRRRLASIERRRRCARASPVPPELVDQFTQGEHAVITVVAGEIQRAGACDLVHRPHRGHRRGLRDAGAQRHAQGAQPSGCCSRSSAGAAVRRASPTSCGRCANRGVLGCEG